MSVLVRIGTAELLCLLLLLNLNRYTDFQPSFFIVDILLVVLFLFL